MTLTVKFALAGIVTVIVGAIWVGNLERTVQYNTERVVKFDSKIDGLIKNQSAIMATLEAIKEDVSVIKRARYRRDEK